MDIYIVKPNLEISDCDNCPSDETLLAKKAAYTKLCKQCSRLSELNYDNSKADSSPPPWCLSPQSNTDNPYRLNIQSFQLTPQDYSKLEPPTDGNGDSNDKNKPDNTASLLHRLAIPDDLPQGDGKWLALKYLQIAADIALLQYRYLKSYSKITKILKKYFSQQTVSEEDETEGFRQINAEMDKFKVYENVLSLLLALKKGFHERYNHFDTPCGVLPSSECPLEESSVTPSISE